MTSPISFSFAEHGGTAGDKGMIPSYVALTTLSDRIRADELAAVAAALQTQIVRDFSPEWGACAVVAAVSFEAIPAGYIPLIVQDTLEAEGTNGFHRTRGDDTPYILVPYGSNWSLAASHELLRMLANPTGSTRLPGPSCMSGQGTVEYLIDVCSPCQDVSAAYAINGVAVSDFCTGAFFGFSGQRYSFTDAVRKPFEPATNGVLTWLADDALLYQVRANCQGRLRVHGGFSAANRAHLLLRELVDMLTPDRPSRLADAPPTDLLAEAQQNGRRARFANMTRFRDDIAWRFGHASVSAAGGVSRREPRRLKAFTSGNARPFQQRARENFERTVGAAS